jgi:hypothetical protein
MGSGFEKSLVNVTPLLIVLHRHGDCKERRTTMRFSNMASTVGLY